WIFFPLIAAGAALTAWRAIRRRASRQWPTVRGLVSSVDSWQDSQSGVTWTVTVTYKARDGSTRHVTSDLPADRAHRLQAGDELPVAIKPGTVHDAVVRWEGVIP